MITRLNSHSGVLATLAPRVRAMSDKVRSTRSKYAAELLVVQLSSRLPSRSDIAPSGMSRPMHSTGSMVDDATPPPSSPEMSSLMFERGGCQVRPYPSGEETAQAGHHHRGAPLWTSQSRNCGLPPSST